MRDMRIPGKARAESTKQDGVFWSEEGKNDWAETGRRAG